MKLRLILKASALALGALLATAGSNLAYTHAYTDAQKTVINHLIKHRLMSELCGRSADETYYDAAIKKHDLGQGFWTDKEAAIKQGYFHPAQLRLKFEFDRKTGTDQKWAETCVAYLDNGKKYN